MGYTYTLRDKIFNFFGVDDKRQDTYKDVNNKGITERYHESLGWGYDDNCRDYIDNARDNIMNPFKMKSTLIPTMESMLGGIVNVSDSEVIRRKIIHFANTLYMVRSTIMGYTIPLRLMGFTTVLIEDLSEVSTFDTGTFDDPDRTFDNDPGCGCGKYRLTITGPVTITQAVLDAVQRVVIFNEPINYELVETVFHSTSGGDRYLREGSGFILREDGGYLLRE